MSYSNFCANLSLVIKQYTVINADLKIFQALLLCVHRWHLVHVVRITSEREVTRLVGEYACAPTTNTRKKLLSTTKYFIICCNHFSSLDTAVQQLHTALSEIQDNNFLHVDAKLKVSLLSLSHMYKYS